MVLFALALESFIRHMLALISDSDQLGSFADDIGCVLCDLRSCLPDLVGLFDQFARVSSLRFNFEKCVVVPFCADTLIELFTDMFHQLASSWSALKVQTHAEYLGFQLGPTANTCQWTSAIRKAADAIQRWCAVKAGFFFIANLDDSLGCFHVYMSADLFVGPGNWLPPTFLTHLSFFGFPVQMRDINVISQAAKIRVALKSSLDIATLSTELGILAILWRRDNPMHEHVTWHNDIFCNNLSQALHKYRLAGASCTASLQNHGHDLQKQITEDLNLLEPGKSQDSYKRLRNRLDRWQIDVLPGHCVLRTLRRFNVLKGKVKPAVLAVRLRTLLNGWVTQRRMRSLPNNSLNP